MFCPVHNYYNLRSRIVGSLKNSFAAFSATASHGGRGDLRRLRVGAGERVFLWNLHDLNELLALRLAMCTSYYSLPRSQIFPLLALRTRTCCSQ